MPLFQALETAKKQGSDLVEVAPTSEPPVCRLLDYGKYKYEQSKKERETKKGQKVAVLREVRLRPKIGVHDFDTKHRTAKKLLAGGDKVKVTILFRGREITHRELGMNLLKKMVELMKGESTIERQPTMEGQRMFIILAPISENQPKAKEEVKQT